MAGIGSIGGVSIGGAKPLIDNGLLGGGGGEHEYSYHQPYSTYKEAEHLSRYRETLRQIDEELALAEKQKQEAAMRLVEAEAAKRQKNAARELAALEATLQEEINRLRMERVWLMRVIDDEEAILVLLLTWPLH